MQLTRRTACRWTWCLRLCIVELDKKRQQGWSHWRNIHIPQPSCAALVWFWHHGCAYTFCWKQNLPSQQHDLIVHARVTFNFSTLVRLAKPLPILRMTQHAKVKVPKALLLKYYWTTILRVVIHVIVHVHVTWSWTPSGTTWWKECQFCSYVNQQCLRNVRLPAWQIDRIGSNTLQSEIHDTLCTADRKLMLSAYVLQMVLIFAHGNRRTVSWSPGRLDGLVGALLCQCPTIALHQSAACHQNVGGLFSVVMVYMLHS